MHKKPFRPTSEITQQFNDGVVRIFDVSDEAAPGFLPKEKLEEKIALRYEERRLGLQRHYAARQNQVHIERVIRVPKSNIRITNQDVAQTEDGMKYRIDLVQSADTFPPSFDLSLVRYEQEGNNGDME